MNSQEIAVNSNLKNSPKIIAEREKNSLFRSDIGQASLLVLRMIRERYIGDRGWSYGDFARKIGVDRAYAYRILHGQRLPSLQIRETIGGLVGMSEDWIWPPHK